MPQRPRLGPALDVKSLVTGSGTFRSCGYIVDVQPVLVRSSHARTA